MKRRLNLAAGLLHDPDILLLDEPTVGVDPQSRNAIFDNLELLKRRGKALLYTTHYMEEAERLADRIVIIDHGRVIANDTLAGLHGLMPGAGRQTARVTLEAVFLSADRKEPARLMPLIALSRMVRKDLQLFLQRPPRRDHDLRRADRDRVVLRLDLFRRRRAASRQEFRSRSSIRIGSAGLERRF